MTRELAGAGTKRPQLDIPINQLELDSENPRLAQEFRGASQLELLKILFHQFNLEEIAYSMAENGYFDEEPIVVVPIKLPKKYKSTEFETVENYETALSRIISHGEIKFTVVEGNRRVASAKLLVDEELRQKLKIAEDFGRP